MALVVQSTMKVFFLKLLLKQGPLYNAANQHLQFRWGFFCDRHNKKLSVAIQRFCEEQQLLTGTGVKVSYEYRTEENIVNASGAGGAVGGGATLESFHILILLMQAEEPVRKPNKTTV